MGTPWIPSKVIPLADERQKELGKPLANPQGFSTEDETFLHRVTSLIDDKRINLYQPSSLLNHPVYDHLPEALQGKVDQQAILLLTKIRDIYWLWKTYQEPTFQIMNLINACRLYKENVEAISGDVFIV